MPYSLPEVFSQGIADIGGMPGALAVAISGGADSAALWRLCADFRRDNGAPAILAPMAVDHRLRAESADEIAAMGKQIAADGYALTVLTPAYPIPHMQGNLQQNARNVRYALMADECRRRGIAHLALGHHADDRAETVLLRLFSGAGAAGLAGMRVAAASAEGITLLRPLLRAHKAGIIAYATERGVTWREDPSNASPKYTRNRIRAFLQSEPNPGETVRRIAASAAALQSEADATAERIARLLPQYLCRNNLREGLALSSRFIDEGEADGTALLRQALRVALQHDAPPRDAQIRQLFARLRRAIRRGEAFAQSLAGRRIDYVPKNGAITIMPE